MGDWYSEAREADGRTDEEVLAETRSRRCSDHDPNSGPGSDWCPNCRQYAAPPTPAMMVNFGPDFTPEQVQTAREQIESLMRPIDVGRMGWRPEMTLAETITWANGMREDMGLAPLPSEAIEDLMTPIASLPIGGPEEHAHDGLGLHLAAQHHRRRDYEP